jgi:hypothetical protein
MEDNFNYGQPQESPYLGFNLNQLNMLNNKIRSRAKDNSKNLKYGS